MSKGGHARLEELSIQLHKAIADKLRENPDSILAIARDNINRWRKNNPDGRSAYYFDRWETLLAGPIDDLIKFMVSSSEDARAMRQAAPFAGVLTNKERWDVIHSFVENWERMRSDATGTA